MKKMLVTTAVLAALGLGGLQMALGQEMPAAAPAPADSDERLLEEVFVTARRQAENLQDVPVAITTFSSQTLERDQITDLQDLRGRVPSLTIGGSGQQRNSESPTVRGQGGGFGASPGVIMYYAEVPLPADFPFNGQGGPGAFFDLANAQVLKGPQGTLFGRNTTGGALLLDPIEPSNDLGGSLAAQGSSYSGQQYESTVNVPIVDETLLLRASFQSVERGGFTEDYRSGNEVDNEDYWTSRLGLTWRPTENIESYLLGYYTNSKNNGTGLVIEEYNEYGLNNGFPTTVASVLGIPADQLSVPPFSSLLAAVFGVPVSTFSDPNNIGCNLLNAKTGSTNCGQDIVAAQQQRGIRAIETSLTTNEKIETGAAIHHLDVEINDSLTLRNIASYTTFQRFFNWDADGSVAELQDLGTPRSLKSYDISQFTEELQLQGEALDERLTYVVGGYYQDVQPEGEQGQQITAFFIPQAVQTYEIEQESWAPYAQATYDLGGLTSSLEGYRATAGLRYTTDQISGSSGSGGTDHSENLEYNEPTYTVGLDYEFDTHLLYGKFSRGYKAGGFSTTAVTPDNYTFDPEYVDSFEIGQKSDFSLGNSPARVNSALYYSDYKDMQRAGIDVNGTSIGSAIFNAGKATIFGAEFEGMIEPVNGLTLSMNYSYMDADYDEYTLRNNGTMPILDCTGNLIPQSGIEQLDCAPFQNAPEHQYAVTASYDLPLDPSWGRTNASITYAWTDEMFLSPYSLPETEPGAWLDSTGLLNASLAWSDIMGSNFDLLFFGTNLTDKDYRISNSNVWNLTYYRSSIYGEPRILGVRLAYHWGE